jgi:hypothetical protein
VSFRETWGCGSHDPDLCRSSIQWDPCLPRITASALFGVAGSRVIEVETEPDGQVTVWVMAEGPTACPCCETVPEDVHESRDRPAAGRAAGWTPWWSAGSSPAGHAGRSSARARRSPSRCPSSRHGAGSRPDCGSRPAPRSPAGDYPGRGGPARRRLLAGGHEAFAAAANPVLDQPHAPVTHLGIDEHRRGRPQWEINPETGPGRRYRRRQAHRRRDSPPDPPHQAVHHRPHRTHAPASPPKQPPDPRRPRGGDTMQAQTRTDHIIVRDRTVPPRETATVLLV